MMNTLALCLEEVQDILAVMNELGLPLVKITKESTGNTTTISYDSTIDCNKHEYMTTTSITISDTSPW